MSRESILDKLTFNHETQIKKTLEDLEAQIISDIAEHKRLLSTQPFSCLLYTSPSPRDS